MHRKKNAMEYNTEDSYQVIATNIKWDSHARSAAAKRLNQDDLPEQMSLDIPAGVLGEIKKKPSEESSIIEQFVYNLLYRKFGREVNYCQIWLPL